MREIERSCCGYIILGLPEKPLRFLMDFAVKKGIRPIVYSERGRVIPRLLPLAKFLSADVFKYDGLGVEALERHTLDKRLRRITLICAVPEFWGFIERNRERLEKRFILSSRMRTIR